MNPKLEHELELEEEATELQPLFAARETMWQMEDSSERQRQALAKHLQSTPVGRALARMGAKITIEKAPPRYAAQWARGQYGFEVQCAGQQPQINVIFGIFDKDRKSVAFYLFSSTVDPKARLACKRSGAKPVVREPFGVDHGAATATHDLFKNAIGVDELVRDATSPAATLYLNTSFGGLTCYVRLNTKSNGPVHLTFGLHKLAEPSRANKTIPGKLFFLEGGPFDEARFQSPRTLFGPLSKAEMIAVSNF
jgi:hypothetical protein